MRKSQSKPCRHFLASRPDDLSFLRAGFDSKADGLFVDLEDAVAPTKKDVARENLMKALSEWLPTEKFRLIRLNDVSTSAGEADLELIRYRPEAVVFPKSGRAEDIRAIDSALAEAESKYGMQVGETKIFVMIETAAALINAYGLLTVSPRTIGAFLGPADFTLSVGCEIVDEGGLSLWSPMMMWAVNYFIVSAKAAGVDHVITALAEKNHDEKALVSRAREFFSLGLTGLEIQSTRHIECVNWAYRPSLEQLARAREIVRAYQEAQARGTQVATHNDHSVFLPFCESAHRVIERSKL